MRGLLSCVSSVIGIILSLCSFPLSSANGSELTFEFTGSVVSVFAPPYGHQVAVTDPVHGFFSYETTSSGVVSGSSMIYLQQLPGKFRATVGNVSISADHFDMVVTNNVTPTQDAIGVQFTSGAHPEPFIVNGVSQPTGYLALNFLASSLLLSDNSLPGLSGSGQSVLQSSNFSTMLGVFSHAPPGGFPPVPPGVQFSITDIQLVAVPEPGTAVLLGGGLPLIVAAISRRKRTRLDAP